MLNFLNLLAEEEGKGGGWMIYIFLGVLVLLMVGMYFMNGRNRKKQQQQQENMFARIGIGTEIKTIGGIIGTVVELDVEAGTYVIETGIAGKTATMKIDKLAIYTANVDTAVAPAAKEEPKAEETVVVEENEVQKQLEEEKNASKKDM